MDLSAEMPIPVATIMWPPLCGLFFSSHSVVSYDYILHIIVVMKKTPMCQIMRFLLYCINGVIEGRHID